MATSSLIEVVSGVLLFKLDHNLVHGGMSWHPGSWESLLVLLYFIPGNSQAIVVDHESSLSRSKLGSVDNHDLTLSFFSCET